MLCNIPCHLDIKLYYLAVIGHKTVYLLLNVGDLRVDRGAKPLFYKRNYLCFIKTLEVGVICLATLAVSVSVGLFFIKKMSSLGITVSAKLRNDYRAR